jgi:hypothetical protein
MKRRDLGMAVLGATVAVAGCSQPVKSLLIPEAEAQGARRPESSSIDSIALASVQVNTVINMALLPRNKNHWRAMVSASGIVEIEKKKLDDDAILYAKVLTTHKVSIVLIGANGEYLGVDIN